MQILTLLLIATGTLGAPLAKRDILSAKNLITIIPSSASCDTTAYPECRTAAQAAPNLAFSFGFFGIDDFNTQAALVALVIYESASFKYSKNHFPGVPGQGTRNSK